MKWNIKDNNSNKKEKSVKNGEKAKEKRSLKDFFKSNLNAFKTKRFKAAGYSTILAVFAVIIVIMVNLVVSSLPAQYIKFDVSRQQLFTISEQTEKVLEELKKDVTLYLVAETSSEDNVINELLDRYAGLSSYVKVEHVDPVLDPTFVEAYTTEDLNNNSVIIVSEGRSRVLDYDDIYVATYEQSSYYYTEPQLSDYYFFGEQLFTSGISYVTSDDLPTLYMLQGHGEADLGETMKKLISLDNIDVQPLSLVASDAVPEDADCLLINAPTSDLSDNDTEKILSYLETGGNLLLITSYKVMDMENVRELMENYGVAPIEGVVVEGSASYYFQSPHYLIPEVESHAITDPLIKIIPM